MAAARSLQSKLLQLSTFSNFIRIRSCDVPVMVMYPVVAKGTMYCVCSQARGMSSAVRGVFSVFSKATSALRDAPAVRSQQQRIHAGALTQKAIFWRMVDKIGFKGRMRFKKGTLRRSGIRMYLCGVELVDYDPFFTELQLPDTFNSWFRITELHIWMCLVKLATEGNEGVYVRNNLLKSMWDDVERRSKKLGALASSSGRTDGINILNEELRANIYSYDEGILSNDMVLAGAVWRNFFEMKCDDPEKIEKVVAYIRKQIAHHESQPVEKVIEKGILTFLPFIGEQLNMERTKPILTEIFRRS